MVEFEQNRMIRTIQNFELFDKNWLTIFDKVLTTLFLENVSMTETIVWC